MTSIDIVRKAIRFQRPPRLPLTFLLLGQSDTKGVSLSPPEGIIWTGTGVDPWGCRWEQSEVANMGQVKGHPLTNLSRIDRYPMPDYSQDLWWRNVEAELAPIEEQQRYVQGGIFMVLFERMHSLCGFENVLMGLLADRPAMERLADRIVEAHLRVVEGFRDRFGRRIHGITMTDDWGTQQAAFVGFDLWMDFFAPRYKRLFDAMHAAGYDVWLHSCGKVNELVEGFIRVGVDVANLQQPRALGIEQMGRRYRGRITFSSLSDIQATLPTGRRDLIETDAEALAEHWMTPEGGFHFSDYGQGEAIGASDESKLIMYRKFSQISERLYGQPLPEPLLPGEQRPAADTIGRGTVR
ncbi:MAG: uroporphyrinogen decarboxylase family protein [Phycisphaerae bacterium]|nr:uroporphyrinogen decarboxylase family protein [Phycisphaerae bacterium]